MKYLVEEIVDRLFDFLWGHRFGMGSGFQKIRSKDVHLPGRGILRVA